MKIMNDQKTRDLSSGGKKNYRNKYSKFISNIVSFIINYPIIESIIFLGLFIFQATTEIDALKSLNTMLKFSIGFLIIFLFRFELKTSIIRNFTFRIGDIEEKNKELLLSLKELKESFEELERSSNHHHHFIPSLREYQNSWHTWKKELPTLPEEDAWNMIMREFLHNEGQIIEKGRIRTTSDLYTSLLAKISDSLNITFDKTSKFSDSSVYRFQFTGMLPDEFYNGHQIEYTTINSKPIFFSHRWEDYSSHYEGIEQPHKSSVGPLVRRCIFVINNDISEANLRGLYTYQDLVRQSNLCINPLRNYVREINNNKDIDAASQLLRMNWKLNKVFEDDDLKMNTDSNALDIIERIVDPNNMTYYPIKYIEKEGQCPRNFEPLLKAYVDHFHHGIKENAIFYKINESSIRHMMLKNPSFLDKYFKSGHIPEISLFGEVNRRRNTREDTPPKEWNFGILGQWVPFTRDMEIQFLTQDEANNLSDLFDFLIHPEESVDSESDLGKPETLSSLTH